MKELIPPVLLRIIAPFFFGWSGNYSSWSEAKKKCTGYDNELIFNKVKEAVLKVKNGEAVFERDSVLFDKIQYSMPLLTALNVVASKNNKVLNVLDFGGSLGSSYYQNRGLFKDLQQFNWCIVEQEHFVKEGQKTFADNQLHFFYDINTCVAEYKINLVVLASVLQYLEKPYAFLDELLKQKIEYIIIDRTPVLIEGADRITIQKASKKVYQAKYPCWILNEQKLVDYFSKEYDLVFDDVSNENMYVKNAHLKAYFFKRKNTN